MNKYPQTSVTSLEKENREDFTSPLFAKNAHIPDVLAALRTYHRSLNMISVGCSIGAELDSTLAVAHTSFQNMQAIGVDKNRAVLEKAEQGAYNTYFHLPFGLRHFQRTRLQRTGLEVTLADHGLEISAAPLRDQAQVSFTESDITKNALPHNGANLIMCNNVICCIGEAGGNAGEVANTLADSLVPGGVISLAVSPDLLKTYYTEHPSAYATTHMEAVDALAQRAMEPVVFAKNGAPIAFQLPY